MFYLLKILKLGGPEEIPRILVSIEMPTHLQKVTHSFVLLTGWARQNSTVRRKTLLKSKVEMKAMYDISFHGPTTRGFLR